MLCVLQSLGLVGRLLKVRGNGDVRVAVNGSRWILNPHCLSPAPGEVPIEEKTGSTTTVLYTKAIFCVSITHVCICMFHYCTERDCTLNYNSSVFMATKV